MVRRRFYNCMQGISHFFLISVQTREVQLYKYPQSFMINFELQAHNQTLMSIWESHVVLQYTFNMEIMTRKGYSMC